MNARFWVAVGLGSGRSPVAPGTTGTLGVLPLMYVMWDQPAAWWIGGLLIPDRSELLECRRGPVGILGQTRSRADRH